MIKINNLGYDVAGKWLVQEVNYTFHPGKIYMICGPNGAGKSTLLRLLSLQLNLTAGEVYYNQEKVNHNHAARYATSRAVLSQHVDISFPLSAEEVIMMGRYPHFDIRPTQKDISIRDAIIENLSLEKFRRRNYLTLSGGEKQRVQFARVLAQIWEEPVAGSRILLLDEPISSLDLKNQLEFLHEVKKFTSPNTIVIAILHDLNLALNYADELLLMSKGRLYTFGKPGDVLNPAHIAEVFGVQSSLHHLPGAEFLWPDKLPA
ncbi:MAG: heme ABC transporter ATP-binding protein [Ferruginibacter sp.]